MCPIYSHMTVVCMGYNNNKFCVLKIISCSEMSMLQHHLETETLSIKDAGESLTKNMYRLITQ